MAETSTKPYLIRAIYEWCNDNGYTPYLAVAVDERTQVPREHVKGGEIVLNVSPMATNRLSLGNDLIAFQARFGGVARERPRHGVRRAEGAGGRHADAVGGAHRAAAGRPLVRSGLGLAARGARRRVDRAGRTRFRHARRHAAGRWRSEGRPTAPDPDQVIGSVRRIRACAVLE